MIVTTNANKTQLIEITHTQKNRKTFWCVQLNRRYTLFWVYLPHLMHSTYKIPKKSRIRSFVSFWKSFCVFLIQQQQQQQNTEIPTEKMVKQKKVSAKNCTYTFLMSARDNANLVVKHCSLFLQLCFCWYVAPSLFLCWFARIPYTPVRSTFLFVDFCFHIFFNCLIFVCVYVNLS